MDHGNMINRMHVVRRALEIEINRHYRLLSKICYLLIQQGAYEHCPGDIVPDVHNLTPESDFSDAYTYINEITQGFGDHDDQMEEG